MGFLIADLYNTMCSIVSEIGFCKFNDIYKNKLLKLIFVFICSRTSPNKRRLSLESPLAKKARKEESPVKGR